MDIQTFKNGLRDVAGWDVDDRLTVWNKPFHITDTFTEERHYFKNLDEALDADIGVGYTLREAIEKFDEFVWRF